jgi:transposase
MAYLRTLREWIQRHGSKNVVYVDESGFYADAPRPHGWAKRGTKVHGLVTGNKKKGRINLIMAQRGQEWLAPMLFDRSCTHHTVNAWVEQALLKELKPNSLIIMDNAPVHNKTYLNALFQQHGHTLMPLPKYSPDFNPIEQSFAIIKRIRQFSQITLENILIGNYKCK